MEGLATEAARLLFSQGGLLGVILVISGLVNVLFYRELQACGAARLTDTRALIEAVQAQTEASRAVALALEGNNRAMDARTRATEEVARQIGQLAQAAELNDERVREKLDELLRINRGGHS